MRYLLVFLILCLFNVANGQGMSYADWKKEAATNIRLLPEYGHATKSPEQKKADQELIDEDLKLDGTHRKASDHLIELGFKYMLRGDLKTAMYRFNQAWLLDPQNENVYWGFGGIYFSFQDWDNAMKMYDKGLLMNASNTNILTDKATIYMAMLNDKFDIVIANKAIELFNRSYAIDPTNPNTSYKMSTLYYSLNDCKLARKYYDACRSAGGQPIAEDYTKALNEKCK